MSLAPATDPLPESAPRVLMTADAVGGVWTYAIDLADGFARRGIATVLAVTGPSPSPAQVEAASAVPGLALVPTDLPLEWLAEDEAALRDAGGRLRMLAEAHDADLIHLNAPALGAGGGFSVPTVAAVHSCLLSWWEAVKAPAPLPEDFGWRVRATAEGIASADRVIAPSRAFAATVSRLYRPARPVQAVPNGRRMLDASQPTVHRGEDIFVLAAGRFWDEGKNARTLDRAAARLPFPLYAAGPLEGPNGARASLAHARSLGALASRDMAGWLARAPLFASVSLYEPFGLAALEAASAGAALVLSDVPTHRELWEGAALFVSPEDDRALANALLSLSRDEAARRRLASAARTRAARFGADRMADETLAVYRDLGLAVPAGSIRASAA